MTNNSRFIVHIVDDDRDLGLSLARLLRRQGYDALPFDSAQQWLGDPAGPQAHCLVSDVIIGDVHGFALAARMRQRAPSTAIVFMTGWPATSDAVDAIRIHGGIDYLEKPIDQERFLGAVRHGVEWSGQRRIIAARTARLTAREREVLQLVADGLTNKEIAHVLKLSAKTIEDHRAAIKAKTGARGLADLIALTRP